MGRISARRVDPSRLPVFAHRDVELAEFAGIAPDELRCCRPFYVLRAALVIFPHPPAGYRRLVPEFPSQPRRPQVPEGDLVVGGMCGQSDA